jgi:hypothetical protein
MNRIGGKRDLVPPALGILIAAGLLQADAARASLWMGIADPAEGDDAGALPGSIFTRTSVLWSNPQWQEFKRVWRKMDAITPVDGEYGGAGWEATSKLRLELQNSLNGLMQITEETGIDSLDISLLHRLTSDRLTFLSYGSMLPLTRMMPPPVSDQTDEIVSQIEARIDTVIRLRNDGLISSEEMETAFDNLRSSLDSYCLLEAISDETGYSGILWSVRWPAEPQQIPVCLDSIRNSVLNNLETAAEDTEEMYVLQLEELDKVESALARTRERLPALHDLLLDLMIF